MVAEAVLVDFSKARKFVTLSARIKALEAEVAKLKQDREVLKTDLMDQLVEAGSNKIVVDGATVYIHQQLWAKPKNGDYESAIAALRLCGLGDLVKETFNTNQLSAVIREMKREDRQIPEALEATIETTDTYDLRVRSGKGE